MSLFSESFANELVKLSSNLDHDLVEREKMIDKASDEAHAEAKKDKSDKPEESTAAAPLAKTLSTMVSHAKPNHLHIHFHQK